MTVADHPRRTIDQLLRTDHLTADLKGHAVRGGAVALISQFARFGLQTCSTIILARLLTPADFGLVAMVAAFTNFIGLFKDLGLTMATVQRAEITPAQVSTLFWINVALSVLLMGVAMALTPVVVWIYDEPRLTGIMLVAAATFVPGGLTAQHLALIRRQMRFQALAFIEVASLAAGLVAALLVVWAGGGYWALVVMTPASALVMLGMVWLLTGWRPGWPQRGVDIKSMLAFGGNLTIFNMTTYFSRSTDRALLGWAWGAGPLGLYERAYNLLMLPVNQINGPLSGVVIPTLSRLQSDPPLYRRYFCRIANLIIYATVPMLAGLVALSQELIKLVLGAQWEGASPIFAMLAISAVAHPLLWTAAWVHTSLGRAYRLRNWGLVTDPIVMASFVIGLAWGPSGVAFCYAVCVNLILIPGMLYAMRDSPVRMRDWLASIWCPFLFSAALFGGALVGRNLAMRTGSDLAALLYGGLGALATGLLFLGMVKPCRTELAALVALTMRLKRGND